MFTGSLEEGLPLNLTCNTRASNGFKYVWYKNRSEVQGQTRKQLIFNSLKRTDGGVYECRVYKDRNKWSNLSERVLLDVKCKSIHQLLLVLMGYRVHLYIMCRDMKFFDFIVERNNIPMSLLFS